MGITNRFEYSIDFELEAHNALVKGRGASATPR